MLKKINYFIVGIVLCLVGVCSVYAREYAEAPNSFTYKYWNNGSFCFDKKTGRISDRDSNNSCPSKGSEKTKYATFGGQDNAIYCAEWDNKIDSETRYYLKYSASKWDPTSERAIVAGAISYYLNSDNVINKNIYGSVGASINHYLANCSKPLANSHNFTNLYSEYKTIIDKAKKYYNDNKSNLSTKTLKKPKFSGNSSGIAYSSGNVYKTKKITISNLSYTQYTGLGEIPKYTITISTNNTNAKIKIPNIRNSYDDNTITVTYDPNNIGGVVPSFIDDNGNVSFTVYIKGDNIANTKLKIKVDVSNKSTYYTSYLYYSKKYKASKQRLIYPGTREVTRKATNSVTMTVPRVNSYNLYINKVDDETGEPIEGATFQLKYNGSAVNLTNDGHGSFSWESGTTTSTYDFSKFELTETRVPNGYISSKNAITFPDVENGNSCYKEVDGEYVLEEDNKYCEHHEYGCTGSAEYQQAGNKCATTTQTNPTKTCDEHYSLNQEGDTCVLDDTYTPETPLPSEAAPHNTCDTENGESYNDQSGKCVKTTLSNAVCLDGDNNTVDSKYCNVDPADYASFTFDGKTLNVDVVNVKNTVTISKTDATGENEVPGAELKICTKEKYTSNQENCEAYTTIDDVEVSWISDVVPRTFSGFLAGDYVIVETIAPSGYSKLTTAVEFNVDNDGKVTGRTVVKVTNKGTNTTTDVVVVKDNLNKVTISKTDIATSKELPGALMSICQAVVSEDTEIPEDNTPDESNEKEDEDEYSSDTMVVNKYTGECIPVVLNDGSRAQWTSTNKPKEIVGLPAGTYYLVEKVSPANYSTAEAILFKMNEDGTVTDKDGKSIANNKIVMKDEPLEDKKTGMLPIIIISIFAFVSLGALAYVYVFKNKKNNNKISNQEL